MKKNLLLTFLCFCVVYAWQIYTWPAASGDFDAPGTWPPSRIALATTDIILFDGSVQNTATVTNTPLRGTIGQLRIANNCTINFSSSTNTGAPGTISRSGWSVTSTGIYSSPISLAYEISAKNTHHETFVCCSDIIAIQHDSRKCAG